MGLCFFTKVVIQFLDQRVLPEPLTRLLYQGQQGSWYHWGQPYPPYIKYSGWPAGLFITVLARIFSGSWKFVQFPPNPSPGWMIAITFGEA